MSNLKSVQTICDFYNGTIDILYLVLRNTNLDLISQLLSERLDKAPDFFNEDPVLIDLREISYPLEVDLSNLKNILKNFHIQLAGVVIDTKYSEWIKNHGLILFESNKFCSKQKKVIDKNKFLIKKDNLTYLEENIYQNNESLSSVSDHICSEEIKKYTTKVISKPLRSGQRVYSTGHLIVLATINPGAEIIAEGDIHIYSSLRGRALAGVRGNLKARIFCTYLDAELIAIAGVYCTAEKLMHSNFQKKSVQVRLHEDSLIFEKLLVN